MIIQKILNFVDLQENDSKKRGLLSEAKAFSKVKAYIKNEIYSEKEAAFDWENSGSDINFFITKISNIIEQMRHLSKEEFDKQYSADIFKKIYYLLRNSNKYLINIFDRFKSSNITLNGSNKDIFCILRDYLQFIKPEITQEFEAFFGLNSDSENSNEIPIESLIEGAHRRQVYFRF